MRSYGFDPCGEKEANPEANEEGDSCPLYDSEKYPKKKGIQRKKGMNRKNKKQ